jgi:hypothetical protein
MSLHAILFSAFAACVFTANASALAPAWPSGVLDEDDPRVIAFYDGQCGAFADRQGLTGNGRQDYLAECRQNAREIWPVGWGEGGSDE